MNPNATPAGIWSVGLHLPEERRTNDWWPPEFTTQWLQSRPRIRSLPPQYEHCDGARAALDALTEVDRDPFQGVRERRVLADDLPPSHMETEAAKQAMERADVKPADIDFIIVQSSQGDYGHAPNSCVVHGGLGLRDDVFALSIESACNGFQHQLGLARRIIGSGGGRVGLLVQSCTLRRQCPVSLPFSAWFGDGATAQVVGPVAAGHGLVGEKHFVKPLDTLRIGVPGGRWDAPGHSELYVEDRPSAFKLLLAIPGWARRCLTEALASAGLRPEDVDVYASHQGTGWLRSVTQQHADLGHARSLGTFEWTASLGASNVPIQLALAEREGLLGEADVVAAFAGGTGSTSTAIVLRWGGRPAI